MGCTLRDPAVFSGPRQAGYPNPKTFVLRICDQVVPKHCLKACILKARRNVFMYTHTMGDWVIWTEGNKGEENLEMAVCRLYAYRVEALALVLHGSRIGNIVPAEHLASKCGLCGCWRQRT